MSLERSNTNLQISDSLPTSYLASCLRCLLMSLSLGLFRTVLPIVYTADLGGPNSPYFAVCWGLLDVIPRCQPPSAEADISRLQQGGDGAGGAFTRG